MVDAFRVEFFLGGGGGEGGKKLSMSKTLDPSTFNG